MSDNGKKRNDGGKRTQKRNLPSWMSSRESLSGGKSHGKKPMDEENDREDTQTNISKGRNRKNGPSKESEQRRASIGPSSSTKEFCKLMEGVVFVLSGFVNPERSTLRSQALAMGAMFQPDWNSDSTLLVCAFPNTPKFRQVEADCGTIVSKEWISECYTQKKLVDIEQYIMHAGKPWRKSSSSQEAHQEKKESPPTKSQKQVEKKSESRGNASASSKNILSHIPAKEQFALTEVKKWAVEDLTQTISWLESQEEKPVPGEIQRIAAEGILTCLQDAIDSLEKKQDVESVTEQWNFIPRVVKELMKVDASRNRTSGASKEELCRQAKAWKELYVDELRKPDDDDDKSSPGNKKQKTDEKGKTGRNRATPRDGSSGYDSDETVEMTEEEIELAYRNVALESC